MSIGDPAGRLGSIAELTLPLLGDLDVSDRVHRRHLLSGVLRLRLHEHLSAFA
jgi:hypothetical protein